ncbi:MAG: phosphate transport system substrate-binding protein [Sphingobacteriales bacterium]|jgi:phosphate transport system substrate-binding protein
MTKKIIPFALVGIFFLSFQACKDHSKNTLKIDGSSTVLPPVSASAEAYKSLKPELNIVLNAGGSGVGVNLLGSGKIDIGMSSRDITAEEKAQFPNCDFKVHNIGKDAVVPVVSNEVYESGVTALTLAQITSIYSGEVNNWKEFGGFDKEILCIDKEKSRGTRHVFMKVVTGDKMFDAPGADLVLGSNNEEQTAISQGDASIGMLSLAWINEEAKGLSVIIQGDTIDPTIENLVNGSFPISRSLDLLTNGNPQGEIKDFIDFLLNTEGQKLVEQAGYVKIKKL